MENELSTVWNTFPFSSFVSTVLYNTPVSSILPSFFIFTDMLSNLCCHWYFPDDDDEEEEEDESSTCWAEHQRQQAALSAPNADDWLPWGRTDLLTPPSALVIFGSSHLNWLSDPSFCTILFLMVDLLSDLLMTPSTLTWLVINITYPGDLFQWLYIDSSNSRVTLANCSDSF